MTVEQLPERNFPIYEVESLAGYMVGLNPSQLQTFVDQHTRGQSVGTHAPIDHVNLLYDASKINPQLSDLLRPIAVGLLKERSLQPEEEIIKDPSLIEDASYLCAATNARDAVPLFAELAARDNLSKKGDDYDLQGKNMWYLALSLLNEPQELTLQYRNIFEDRLSSDAVSEVALNSLIALWPDEKDVIFEEAREKNPGIEKHIEYLNKNWNMLKRGWDRARDRNNPTGRINAQ